MSKPRGEPRGGKAGPPRLRRTLGFWALASYGLGDILGAGIYALMGKVAGVAGSRAWLSFCVSLVAASLTALSYSELVARFPRSGGESTYCLQGFRSPLVSTVIGWLVFCAGTLSLSAIAVVFAGYLGGWKTGMSEGVVVALFIAVLGAINFRGIRESSVANIVCTVIEASGLVIVIVVGLRFLAETAPASTQASMGGSGDWSAVMRGAALAFFAFIGFQDMVNVAEEVEEPGRNFPRAILTALAVAGLTYVGVAWIATRVIDPAALGDSSAPLTDVVRRAADERVVEVFPVIALFAVANTGLLNFVMASRLLYGMADQQLLPARIARIHPERRTPHWAIATVLVVALALALSGSLGYLAGATSTLLLLVFAVVNAALVGVKWRERGTGQGAGQAARKGGASVEDAAGEGRHGGRAFRVPLAVPLLAIATTGALIGFAEPSVLLTVAGLATAGAGLYGLRALQAR